MRSLVLVPHLKSFYTGYVLFVIAGLIILFFIPYGDEVILLNQQANPTFDTIALFITNLGLGSVFIIPILITLFTRYYFAISALMILLLTGLITFLFKQVFFQGLPRPMGLLGSESFTHLIQGFEYHSMNTFPSGHTITAFSLAMFAAFTLKNNYLNYIFLLLAIAIGISRIYLLQHFFADVFVGSILGICATFLGFYLTKIIFRHNSVIMQQRLVINAKNREKLPMNTNTVFTV